MIRVATGALLGVLLLAGASRAAEIDGKLKSVDPDKRLLVLTIDGKEREFTIPEKADITVQDIKPYKPKDGLKDEAFKTKDRLVRLTVEKKDGKEVVTALTIYTGRRGVAMATLVQAVRLALHYGEEHLGVTDIFGEDVGPPLGGVFTATQGLRTAWNSPLDERGIVGTAMGIAYAGGRPVAEIQFCDYGFNTIDLLKVAGNQRWAGGGNFDMPIVLMTPSGSGIRGSLYHSHSFESWASRLAGWKVVMPSNALDAYGLMLSAIVDPNPVLVLLPKALLRVRGGELIPGEPEDPEQLKEMIDAPVGDRSQWKPRWPDLQPYFVKFGVASLVREGTGATVISYGRTLPLCRQAADQLRDERGLSFDVLDLRSIFPYDWKAISASVLKTGRVLIVNEDTEVTNFGEHLLRRVVDEHFYDLPVRPRCLMGKHVPGIGLNQVYEQNTVPQLPQVREAMLALATEQA